MQNSEDVVTRDRAWMRHIYIKKTDFNRFNELCCVIPRDKFITMITVSNDKDVMCIHAKLKEQELLVIKLSMNVIAVKKPRRRSRVSKSQ